MRLRNLFSTLVLCALIGLAACSPKPIPPQPRPLGSIAVAPFSAPQYNWELLAGYLPDEGKVVPAATLTKLDEALGQIVHAHGVSVTSSPAAVHQCQEIVTSENTGKSRESAWTYWLTVGDCVPTDFLLVPQVLRWKEFDGGGNPASVVIDLYLIDVKGKRLVSRYHYDETQKALTDNLLDIGKYMHRKGQWVPAADLAREGLETGLKEIGL